MRKILPFFLLFAACAASVSAQSKVTVSPGLELSIPTGDFADVAGVGFGVSGRIQYAMQRDLGFIGTIGYTWWGSKTVGSVKYSASALQILVGPKYYFQKNFYGLAELGISSVTGTVKGTVQGLPYERSDTESNFMLSLGAGYEYEKFEFEVKYFLVDPDVTNLAFRAGYRFTL